MKRFFVIASAFCSFLSHAGTAQLGNLRDTDEVVTNVVVDVTKGYVDGKDFIVSPLADTYRNGASGQLGTGYAHSAMTGDGKKMYAAYAPCVNCKVRLVSTSDENPLIEYFAEGGTLEFDSSEMKRTVTSISEYVDDCGKGDVGYNSVRVSLAPNNEIPIAVEVSKNILQNGVSLYSADTTNYDSISLGSIYIYSFYNNGGGDFEYYAEWYDSDIGDYVSAYCSFSVEVEGYGENEYVMTVFGSGGQLLTSSDVDTARSQKILRTGKRGELGTGYGYKIYDFTSDVREWELKVPRLDVPNVPTFSINSYSLTVSTNGYGYIEGNKYSNVYYYRPSNFLNPNLPQFKSYKYVDKTYETYSADGCKKVDYNVGIFPLDTDRVPHGGFMFNLKFHNSVGTSYGYYADAEYVPSDIYIDKVVTNSFSTGSYGSSGKGVYVYKCIPNVSYTLTNTYTQTLSSKTMTFTVISKISDIGIRYARVSGTQDTYVPPITVNNRNTYVVIGYNVEWETTAYYYDANSVAQYAPYGVKFKETCYTPLTFTAYPSTLETVRTQASRIITDINNNMIYDEELGVTWEIKVKNGSFYGTILGTKDYRKEDY